MSVSTIPDPVKGKVHLSSILGSPFSVVWVMHTMIFPPAPTESIAPIPLSALPGITQFARSPLEETCSPPMKNADKWPPLNIPYPVELLQNDVSGRADVVSCFLNEEMYMDLLKKKNISGI